MQEKRQWTSKNAQKRKKKKETIFLVWFRHTRKKLVWRNQFAISMQSLPISPGELYPSCGASGGPDPFLLSGWQRELHLRKGPKMFMPISEFYSFDIPPGLRNVTGPSNFFCWQLRYSNVYPSVPCPSPPPRLFHQPGNLCLPAG